MKEKTCAKFIIIFFIRFVVIFFRKPIPCRCSLTEYLCSLQSNKCPHSMSSADNTIYEHRNSRLFYRNSSWARGSERYFDTAVENKSQANRMRFLLKRIFAKSNTRVPSPQIS